MNGSDSDEENAMAYFLPNGITDDSPPKRSMLPPGSFGPIGGRTPTAAAGLTSSGFHRSNSPSFLHLNASPSANNTHAIATSGGAPTTAMAGSVITATGNSANTSAGSSSSLGGGSFSLADLGGEIHQPRASEYGAVSDSSNTSIGPFGYARAFRSGMQSESENALQSDATATSSSSSSSLIFGRASSTVSSLVRNPFSRGLSSPATTGAPYFNSTPSASPFAQENATTNSLPRNWPTPGATTAPATNPRRVFQAPPGLGGPDSDNPAMLGLGGDYLASRLMASSDTSGLQQRVHQVTSSSPFGVYATTTSPVVSDAFLAPGTSSSSVGQFGSSSLSSPLPSLHLTSDVFSGSSQLLSTNQRAEITNPDLAELNSHSMTMRDDATTKSAFSYQEPSSARQTGSPGVKEIQSMKVDVQAGSKTSKPLTASAQPFQYQPSADHILTAQQQQQQQSSTSQKRMFEKKKQGAFQTEFPPMSPSSYREMLVSPASSGRGAEHRQVKSVTGSQLRSSATSSPTAAPRSSPAAFSETKSSLRFKKRAETQTGGGGGLRPSRSGVESYSGGGGGASTGADADYESSDSADFGFVSDSGDSPIKTSPDARRVQVREKNDKSSSSNASRSAKKERPARSTSTQEKAPVGSAPARRQVYREKQPKEQQQHQAKSRLKSDIQSSDELEIAVLNAKSEQLREGKARGRRAKDSETTTVTSSASTTTTQSAGGKSSRQAATPANNITLERADSSDLETSKGKKSPKQLNKPSSLAGEKQPAKANVDTKPKSGNATTDSVDSPRAASLKSEKASDTQEEKREVSDATSVATDTKTVASSEKSDDASAAEAVNESPAQEKRSTVDRSALTKRSAAVETPPSEEISPTEPPSQMVEDAISSSEHTKSSASSDRKHAAATKESHRKEKNSSKRDKTTGDKKKHSGGKQQQKKEKRDSPPRLKGESFDVSDISDLDNGILEMPVVSRVEVVKEFLMKLWSAVLSLVLYVTGVFRSAYTYVSSRLNIKGVLGTALYHVESVTAVVFSVLLLLSLHGASWFIRIHRVAFRAILTHRHIGFCFAFLYAFPFLVQYVFPWAPPWAPVCLWYAFLVQLFCTNGPTAMVTTFRILLPLVFLVEGISHHSFLLDLNGAELLLASFIISALKTSNLCSPIFFISLAAQCLSAVFLGSELVVQWFQMALALYSLHSMVASEDDWNGFGDEEEELSCQQSMSMHHSIADYNHHPAPSAASIQKTKRLDRRALAYVRGRKFR